MYFVNDHRFRFIMKIIRLHKPGDIILMATIRKIRAGNRSDVKVKVDFQSPQCLRQT